MSSSRARTRLAAVFAAIPVLVAGGPLVGPAAAVENASDVRQAALVDTSGSYRIGPRAGFRGDVARGINGNTAVVAFDASPSATLSRVSVSVVQSGPFAMYDEFDPTDGFAIYKDLDDNDRLDPADFAAGPVSAPRYDIGFGGGTVLVTVTADPAKATGEDSYLLTVHPSSNLSAERVVKFAIPANGIATTAGATFPGTAVTLDDIVIDSKAPTAIPLANFTPVSRAPQANCPTPAPAAGCGDDFYRVFRSAPAEPSEKLAFFNAPGDLSDAALLTKQSGNDVVPAIYDVSGINTSSTSPSELGIGNGTGRVPGVAGSRALNNQISDDIVAVQWDLMGNTAVTPLNNTPTCDQNTMPAGCTAQPPKGNDVTGVSLGFNVTMGATNAATADLAAVPVTTTMTSASDSGVDSKVLKTQVRAFVRPQRLQPVAGSNPAQYTVAAQGAEVNSGAVTPASNGTIVVNVNVADATTFPQNERLWSAVRLVDAYGNPSTTGTSTAQLKDTVRPTFDRISLIDVNSNGVPDAGETYRIVFNDTMDRNDLDTAAELNSNLTIADPGPCGAAGCPSVNWGAVPTASWSDPARVLTIKLGAECSTAPTTDCRSVARLPRTGDVVTATSSVSDWNENAMATSANNVAISAPAIVPLVASTVDSAGVGESLFGTSRDGVLDQVKLEFTRSVSAASVTAASNAGHFSVTAGGATVPATAARSAVAGEQDTVIVSFTVPTTDRAGFRTGATPLVTLKANSAGSTLLEAEGPTEAVAPFTLAAADKAAPVPVSIKTQDSNANGKLDTVLVEFTEAIRQRAENACGWTVTGYQDGSYAPHGFPTPGLCSPARNQPSAVPSGAASSNVVALKLPEGAAFDTHVAPFVEFRSTNAVPPYAPGSAPACVKTSGATTVVDCPVVDMANNDPELANKLGLFAGTAADAAGPALIDRWTADTNSDGRLDEVRTKFSEKLSTPSIQFAQFTLSDPAFTILPSFSVPSDTEVYLRLENASQRTGNTGVTPKLTFQGGTTDVLGVPSPADKAPVLVADRAAPAIMAACASSPAELRGSCPVDEATADKVAIFFSEPVASGSVAPADFAVEQPAGTAKTPTAFAMEDSDKRVVLTFAEGAVKSDLDGRVRFATGGAANGVLDKAAPANTSTQNTNVPMFAAPTVTLNITCPTPANDGYCHDNKVNTGATGSNAVTRWRLAESPRATLPADSEFKSGLPSVYPESGVLAEGPHTLYLSGKDELGRLSPEISDSITILKPPTIGQVQFSNATTRRADTYPNSTTVLDGDAITIRANAYGTDAEEWAENNAPTDGGCLNENMSIDIRSLSGVSTHSAVAPFRCDLQETTPPHRQMQFSLVTARGTTNLPVGTAIKVTASDPGSIIVDGANGKLARRQFVSVNARRSWMIPDAAVIQIPVKAYSGIPLNTKKVGYRDGAVLKSPTGGYYYMENGVKRPVAASRLAYWKIPTTRAYAVTSTELSRIPSGATIGGARHAVGTWIKSSTGTIYQIVKKSDGAIVRRKLSSASALRTRVPSTHVYPLNSYDSKLPIDSWLIGYRDGTLLKFSDGTYGVIARGSLRKFANALTFNTLRFTASHALTVNSLAMPRVSGQAFRIGAVIERYKLGAVVIKVTNKAGATVTALVPNSDGLYGVGTLDPAPADWDYTR